MEPNYFNHSIYLVALQIANIIDQPSLLPECLPFCEECARIYDMLRIGFVWIKEKGGGWTAGIVVHAPSVGYCVALLV